MCRRRLKIVFCINTKEIYEVIIDIPISLNLLFNFPKEAISQMNTISGDSRMKKVEGGTAGPRNK